MKTMQKFILLAIVFATQAYAVVHSHSEMYCLDNKGNVAKEYTTETTSITAPHCVDVRYDDYPAGKHCIYKNSSISALSDRYNELRKTHLFLPSKLPQNKTQFYNKENAVEVIIEQPTSNQIFIYLGFDGGEDRHLITYDE